MFVLYCVKDIEARLGIIMGFTTLFSIRSVTKSFNEDIYGICSIFSPQLASRCFPLQGELRSLPRLLLSRQFRLFMER